MAYLEVGNPDISEWLESLTTKIDTMTTNINTLTTNLNALSTKVDELAASSESGGYAELCDYTIDAISMPYSAFTIFNGPVDTGVTYRLAFSLPYSGSCYGTCTATSPSVYSPPMPGMGGTTTTYTAYCNIQMYPEGYSGYASQIQPILGGSFTSRLTGSEIVYVNRNQPMIAEFVSNGGGTTADTRCYMSVGVKFGIAKKDTPFVFPPTIIELP